MDTNLASTMALSSGTSSSAGLSAGKPQEQDITDTDVDIEIQPEKTIFEEEFDWQVQANYSSMVPRSKLPFKQALRGKFSSGGALRPFRLLKQDLRNMRKR